MRPNSDYFRRLFAKHPKWLWSADSTEAWAQIKKDFPKADAQDRQYFYSTKSMVRKAEEAKKEAGLVTAERKQPPPNGPVYTRFESIADRPAIAVFASKAKERLEESIDECLAVARAKDLPDVAAHLRAARNQLVLM